MLQFLFVWLVKRFPPSGVWGGKTVPPGLSWTNPVAGPPAAFAAHLFRGVKARWSESLPAVGHSGPLCWLLKVESQGRQGGVYLSIVREGAFCCFREAPTVPLSSRFKNFSAATIAHGKCGNETKSDHQSLGFSSWPEWFTVARGHWGRFGRP